MAGMYDVVVKLLELQLKEAETALKEGKQSNAPDLKGLESAVEDAKKALEKYQSSDGSERKRLNDKYLQDYYETYGSWVEGLVRENPELAGLFAQAIKNNWSATTFQSKLFETPWWKQHGEKGHGNIWFEAYKLENDPSQRGAWIDAMRLAKEAVSVAATKENVVLDAGQLENIARMYIYSGWKLDPAGLTSYMQKRATNPNQEKVTTPGGDAAAPTPGQQFTETELRDLAESYGITVDPKALAEWVRKMNDPKINVDQVIDSQFRQWLVNESRSRYTIFGDQIDENTTLRQLTGAYTSTLANLLEMDPTQLRLDQTNMDPLLKQALTTINPETGQPERVPLWKFEQMVRQDDRWQLTNNARQTYMNAGTGFLRALGFVG